MKNEMIDPSKRSLLKGSGAAIAASFAGPIAALATRVAEAATLGGSECLAAAATLRVDSPYGAIGPVNDLTTGLPLIQLPAGFSYKSYGWIGDIMTDGIATPTNHDGMGIISTRRVGRSTEMVLVRNHEASGGTSFGPSSIHYEASNRGGTTNLVFRDGNWVESYASLSGTVRNCAGGSSNWGSWLSNEETFSNNLTNGKLHGYNFEVSASGSTNTNPIIGMGRMNHEASALDVDTGYWYLTEDQSNANTLYRFRPTNDDGGLGSLHAGGVLEGLKVVGLVNADLRNPTLCQTYQCEWTSAIENPDLNTGTVPNGTLTANASGPYRQAYALGAARFGANEGCWVANGTVFFTDKAVGTLNGITRAGRIWALDLDTMVLKAILVSNDRTVCNSPDNICISPRGGMLICEDGGGIADPTSAGVAADRLISLRADGAAYIFARNNYNFTSAQLAAAGKPSAIAGNRRNTEWAGGVFSQDGRYLFVNIQGPGITLAITGPWTKGTL